MGVISAIIRTVAVYVGLAWGLAMFVGGLPFGVEAPAGATAPLSYIYLSINLALPALPGLIILASLWPRFWTFPAIGGIWVVAAVALVEPSGLDFVFEWWLRSGPLSG